MCCSEIIDSALNILSKYELLLNASVIDHYTDSHWLKLPTSWQTNLHTLQDLEDIVYLLDNTICRTTRVWPLSLLALRAAVGRLSIPRRIGTEQDPSAEPWQNMLGVEPIFCGRDECPSGTTSQDDTQTCSEVPVDLPYLATPRLKNAFKKNVKPKKYLEIESFSKIVAATARSMSCKYVVDIGSGVGHLSRRLAYAYGLSVCCIEGQPALSTQAERLDSQMEATLRKCLADGQMNRLTRPVHLNRMLDEDTDYRELMESVKTAFGLKNLSDLRFGLVGLHTCGDLAPGLMRLLISCPNAVFINIVGCCFMKISVHKTPCYPMSSFLATRTQPSSLSYEAREVACHANEAFCQRLQTGNCQDLKVHCYRATLQEIIGKNWPHLLDSGVTSVKCVPDLPFREYSSMALSKHGVAVPEDDLLSEKTLRNLSEWKRVVAVVSLRLLLAPLVETVILLDRLLYFREQGLESFLLPIFDPLSSPRNHVLTAMKR